MDPATGITELPSSVSDQFACYDLYEICDLNLSRLAIEALVHPVLRAEVVVQHGHKSTFKKCPGKIYLMMVLQVCHASFSYKLDKAATKFASLRLVDFLDENISKFANEAQRLIKILKGGYSLSYQLALN